MRIGSRLGSLKFAEIVGGRSHAAPNSFRTSSLIATKRRFSQNPSGLSACGGISSDSGPSSSPHLWSKRVSIEVPERCAPAMQTATLVCARFGLKKLQLGAAKPHRATRSGAVNKGAISCERKEKLERQRRSCNLLLSTI